MTNRKILYGYQIVQGKIAVQEQEAIAARHIATLYINGLSFQKIADALNNSGIPFSPEATLWNKHKVKRLLENPRYAGKDGYPAIIDEDAFRTVQERIQENAVNRVPKEKRPAQQLCKYLHCSCGNRLRRLAIANHGKCEMYFKCDACGKRFAIPDAELLSAVFDQMAERKESDESTYMPSCEVVRLANAINRGLEHPDAPENIVSLILQGISARYDCCPNPIKFDRDGHADKTVFKCIQQEISAVVISEENVITVHFK